MEKIHTADNAVLIGYLKSLLEAEGIACNVRNELLSGGSGELPPTECWPELWVWHDEDIERARRIVQQVLNNPASEAAAWQCSYCQERSEGQFTACWQCGSLRR